MWGLFSLEEKNSASIPDNGEKQCESYKQTLTRLWWWLVSINFTLWLWFNRDHVYLPLSSSYTIETNVRILYMTWVFPSRNIHVLGIFFYRRDWLPFYTVRSPYHQHGMQFWRAVLSHAGTIYYVSSAYTDPSLENTLWKFAEQDLTAVVVISTCFGRRCLARIYQSRGNWRGSERFPLRSETLEEW